MDFCNNIKGKFVNFRSSSLEVYIKNSHTFRASINMESSIIRSSEQLRVVHGSLPHLFTLILSLLKAIKQYSEYPQ